MSILPPSNAFLVTTRFATFLLRVLIRSYVYSARGSRWCWSSLAIILNQNGLESWNDDQGCLVGGTRTVGGKTATCVRLLQRCAWLQQADHLRYITMQVKIGFSFPFLFRSSIVWWCKVNVACWCVSTTMIHNAYISIGTLIFYFISNPKQFFLFLIWRYLLHRISYFGCSTHHVQFALMLHVTIILVCFTLACCTISMHITVILVVMLKSAILLPKNSMCPI